ncbi:hypothetical protein M407DRAFT_132049 [Tulasnella calospora MUT 4182]|uniref:Uncharacterized protein n=1 Tax=Tulasnella calospora MUT 4182 TaxID=1051891 RepID=A0A0C3KHN5_9AGAM|nr:hypothetical protein M407DRAFT_132049 [Tulasnella calospora MUT 4182]
MEKQNIIRENDNRLTMAIGMGGWETEKVREPRRGKGESYVNADTPEHGSVYREPSGCACPPRSNQTAWRSKADKRSGASQNDVCGCYGVVLVDGERAQ